MSKMMFDYMKIQKIQKIEQNKMFLGSKRGQTAFGSLSAHRARKIMWNQKKIRSNRTPEEGDMTFQSF